MGSVGQDWLALEVRRMGCHTFQRMKTLYPAQARARDTLIAAIGKHGAALDASETGLGKTVVACHVAAALGRPVAVVCPKIVIPSWKREMADAGVEPLFVLNYEKIRNGSTPWLSRARKRVYRWNLPPDTVLIIDECHKCGGDGTQNSALHMAATHQGIPTIDLSATCASSPTGLRAVGYALGLHSNLDRKEGTPSYYTWLRAHGAWQDPWRKWQPGAAKHLVRVHSKIFGGDPPRGVRLTVSDMPDAFKGNHVIEEILDFGPGIRKFYEEAGLTPEIVEAWLETGEIPEEEHFLVAVLRARQLAELQKAPAMIEMARDLVDEGKSVAIFVNFTETLDTISRALDGCVVIRGGQTGDDREEAVRKFQSDEARVVVANIAAGGAGVSLHDVNGNHPRVSLISPSFSVVEYVQTLGRIYRNGMKTPALQKILIAADTIETSVVKALKKKTDRMMNLLDGGGESVY